MALQGIYSFEFNNVPISDLLEFAWLDETPDGDTALFATSLIEGTIKNLDELDIIIRKYSRNWDFNRIDLVDKTILRMALFEMKFINDIPPAVSIDEAIELAKIFGSDNSGQFINGVLDSAKKELS